MIIRNNNDKIVTLLSSNCESSLHPEALEPHFVPPLWLVIENPNALNK